VQSLKILIAAAPRAWRNGAAWMAGMQRNNTMSEKTCAACDYPLDASAITVKIGGQAVEVCCEECATKLREAYSATTQAKP
jgi:RNase P subunit RPR2